jgi:hypothetical protein
MIFDQRNRKNPNKPTVSPGRIKGLWWAQGIDPSGKYHADVEFSLEAAHRIATGWAANGYPSKDAK